MYQFHGWFQLRDTVEDTFDGTPLEDGVDGLRTVVAEFDGSLNAVAEIQALNGEYYLWINGSTNRRRFPGEAATVDDVLAFLAEHLPGSYGLMYERDDEMTEPPGGNAFRVRRLARGVVTEHDDPFLSPANPTIEI
ncbi:hypothetical protein JOF56_003659 [Kibdelosporangium banguiense]|uniref:Immunity protein 7 n=1 Tax=Kibdelosporangium banguiense TaxID=1365924 RepID=A0ABS4TH05_9PSEU|nr:Imm7 family immunity protein [Kibdelosporangium banguiense]MBP2323274.1 hypothetical protein [Kibdelosporangium banguiense]